MILWIIAAICAFFVKGLCGFANTLVFTSILSFGVNNSSISPVELLLGYPGNLFLGMERTKKKSIGRSADHYLHLLCLAVYRGHSF